MFFGQRKRRRPADWRATLHSPLLTPVHVLNGHVCMRSSRTQVAVDGVTFSDPYTSRLLTVAVTEEAGSELWSRAAGEWSPKHTWGSIPPPVGRPHPPAASGAPVDFAVIAWLCSLCRPRLSLHFTAFQMLHLGKK